MFVGVRYAHVERLLTLLLCTQDILNEAKCNFYVVAGFLTVVGAIFTPEAFKHTTPGRR